ncbi:MAG: CDP-diacylglycerol--glycerol-3-phosphate 3-phosphatidyltransferase [Provencibacterium sp.]|jgi:CDP-diacylglycerol--glycerol-3-phosphate 3-phosphatidyltransferase|nr:CDP-diacylglycerol--glycerol-3-phosphate 3-phosphatidyltransferase [Provencibacterium sp.]
MNLPNRLTMLRVFLIPVFLCLFYLPFPGHFFFSLAVFIAASLTDMLDGRIARSRGLITDFGKFMDPLADKLLVVSALICLMDLKMVPALVAILLISREFLVTSLRLVAAPKGIVIAADRWGKYKTASQMVWISVALLLLALSDLGIAVPGAGGINALLLAVVTLLTLLSGINYLFKNRGVLKDC